jgi:hypothetical protein
VKSVATVGRSLAELLMHITATTLPVGRAAWGAAMRAELCHIGDDREALRWAFGCLQTSLLESFRSGMLLDLRLVRWSVSLWAMFRAENSLCDTCLVLSHKFPRLWLPPFFAHCAQGYDYQQLIPLFDATAGWEVAVCLLSDVFYLLAIVSLLRRNRNAAGFFLVAVILNLTLWLYELAKPLYLQSFSLADHAQDAILYVTTALLSWILWHGTRAPHAMQR